MKNSCKSNTLTQEEGVSPAPAGAVTPSSDIEGDSQWGMQTDSQTDMKGQFNTGAQSDRTSMSADSPASRQNTALTPCRDTVKVEVSNFREKL